MSTESHTRARPAVLLADDQPEPVRPLLIGLEDAFDIMVETRAARVTTTLDRHPEIAVVLLDLTFEGQRLQGEELIRTLRSRYPIVPVVILTASSDVDLALRLVHGERLAHYYFVKQQVDVNQLTSVVEHAATYALLSDEKIRMTDRGAIVGTSESLRRALRAVGTAAANKLPVLLVGEPGTGKELIARAIHISSPRRHGPLVPMPCRSLHGDRASRVLFGSFLEPGRTDDVAKGCFEQAQGGTLYLAQLTTLAVHHQAEILQTLESGEVRRPDGSPLTLDVRVVASIDIPLKHAVRSGLLQPALAEFVSAQRIELPALRDRPEDIPSLAAYFMSEDNPGRQLTADAIQVLRGWPFAGNARELRSVLLRAMVEFKDDPLPADALQGILQEDTALSDARLVEHWARRVMSGAATWRELRKEFRGRSEGLRGVLLALIRLWKAEYGKRPSGEQLAKALRIERNHLNQLLTLSQLKLRDFD